MMIPFPHGVHPEALGFVKVVTLPKGRLALLVFTPSGDPVY
jgi:hypothetical protein